MTVNPRSKSLGILINNKEVDERQNFFTEVYKLGDNKGTDTERNLHMEKFYIIIK